MASKLKIHDTCGVNNLHGMPGVLAGIIGAIVSALATEDSYGLRWEQILQCVYLPSFLFWSVLTSVSLCLSIILLPVYLSVCKITCEHIIKVPLGADWKLAMLWVDHVVPPSAFILASSFTVCVPLIRGLWMCTDTEIATDFYLSSFWDALYIYKIRSVVKLNHKNHTLWVLTQHFD